MTNGKRSTCNYYSFLWGSLVLSRIGYRWTFTCLSLPESFIPQNHLAVYGIWFDTGFEGATEP